MHPFRLLAVSAFATALAPPAGMAVQSHKRFEIRDTGDMTVAYRAGEKRQTALNRFAAEELADHLGKVFGARPKVTAFETPAETPGRFDFIVGMASDGRVQFPDMATEGSVYEITAEAVYFHGPDVLNQRDLRDILKPYGGNPSLVPTLFAVYLFLENECGVRWVWPGETGVSFDAMDSLALEPQTVRWKPEMDERRLRAKVYAHRWLEGKNKAYRQQRLPEVFRIRDDNRKELEMRIWTRRMRMGVSRDLPWGHGFHGWREKYGDEHPEWFALTHRAGGRGPIIEGRDGQMCPTAADEGLADAIVAQWRERRQKLANRPDHPVHDYIRVIENDGSAFCECEECQEMDGYPFDRENYKEWKWKPKTDRYVYLYKEVLERARKLNPDVKATVYAYSAYKYPPEKFEVSDDLVIKVVSMDPDILRGWHGKGARHFYLRPNTFHGLARRVTPVGRAGSIHDEFREIRDLGIHGADFDALLVQWPLLGLDYYIIARALTDAGKPYRHWADQYFAAFGGASDHVRDYYETWQRYNEEGAQPELDFSDLTGGRVSKANAYRRNLRFSESCFTETGALLEAAAETEMAPRQRKRFEALRLAHEHQYKTWKALKHAFERHTHPDDGEKAARSKRGTEALYGFRKEHADALNDAWVHLPHVFWVEQTRRDDPLYMNLNSAV